MSYEIEKSVDCNQIFTSKFLILYAFLRVMEPVIKGKRQGGIFTQTIFHNKRKRAHIKACSSIRKVVLYERRVYIQWCMIVSFKCAEKINKMSTENQQKLYISKQIRKDLLWLNRSFTKMPMRKINVTNIVSIKENLFQMISIEK